MRYENWKFVFMEQRAPGTMRVWAEPFTQLRVPKLFDLRADPYERADITSNTYYDWFLSQPYLIFAAQEGVGTVPGHLQGVPAQPAGRELQRRSDRRQDAEVARGLAEVSKARKGWMDRERVAAVPVAGFVLDRPGGEEAQRLDRIVEDPAACLE